MVRSTRPMTGSALLCEALKAHGVRIIFGYPGGAALPLYRELAEHDEGLRHVLVRHEENAALAADGYARATGFPGVCLATSGPGATNLLTGIATAMMDSVPLLALTGQVATTRDRHPGVPGGRHRRDGAAGGQGRLPGPHAGRGAGTRRRGVPDHARGAPRAGAARPAEGRPDGHGDGRGAAAGRGADAGRPRPASTRRWTASPRCSTAPSARCWRSGGACCWPARWTPSAPWPSAPTRRSSRRCSGSAGCRSRTR